MKKKENDIHSQDHQLTKLLMEQYLHCSQQGKANKIIGLLTHQIE